MNNSDDTARPAPEERPETARTTTLPQTPRTPPPAPPTASSYGSDVPPPPAPSAAEPEPRRRRAPLLLAGVLIGAIAGGGAGAVVAEWVDDDPPASVTRSDLSADTGDDNGADTVPAGTDVRQVAEAVSPSVVSITAQGQFGGGGGTGVIISSDGEILTNNHVVQAAGQGGEVLVTFADGTTASADIVGTDPLTDLAVIKAQGVSDLTPAELGSSADLAVGQQVVAIGSPLGLEGTVTSGIVSAINRPVRLGETPEQTVVDAIQTDAPINPGNSGGPLVDMNGQVVGINSAIATTGSGGGSIGLGFSIPIDQAKPIAEELVAGREATHAQIGVNVGSPPNGERGALIAGVNSGSAGDEAGLREGDVVTRVGDRLITDPASLIAAVRSYRPGDEVTLTYVRDGEEHTVDVTLGSDADAA